MILTASNVMLKITLLILVIHALLFNELTQYRAKAFGIRIVAYPILATASFIVYQLVLRNKKLPYPILIDLCLTIVVVADFAGNTLNLYDSIAWWDDAMHFLITIPWAVAGGALLTQRYADISLRFLLTLGYGAVTHVLWEIFEYLSFVRSNSNEYSSAYKDTVGDLVMSLGGTFIGALVVAFLVKSLPKSKKR